MSVTKGKGRLKVVRQNSKCFGWLPVAIKKEEFAESDARRKVALNERGGECWLPRAFQFM